MRYIWPSCAIQGFLNWTNSTCSNVYFHLTLNNKSIMKSKTILVQSHWFQLCSPWRKGQHACVKNLLKRYYSSHCCGPYPDCFLNLFPMLWPCNQKIMIIHCKKTEYKLMWKIDKIYIENNRANCYEYVCIITSTFELCLIWKMCLKSFNRK